MKSLKIFSAVALVFGAVLFSGCSDLVSEKNDLEYGSVVLSVQKENNQSRAIYKDDLKIASVTISGYDYNGEKFSKVSDNISITNGSGEFSITEIPVCNNAVIEVQAKDKNSEKISGIVLYSVNNINAGSNKINVTWDTSCKGKVYYEILKNGTNTNDLDEKQLSSINNAIPSDTHASLINAAAIASDFKAGSLKSSSSYILEAGTVKVTVNDCSGCTIQVSDPNSKVSSAVSGDSAEVTISDVAPGTWNVYAVSGDEVKASASVTISSGETKTVTVGEEAITDKIIVHVPTTLNYNYCYAWGGTAVTAKWPGDKMTESGSYYIFTLGCTSTKIIFNNGSGGSAGNGQTADLYIPSAGEYWYIGGSSGTADTSGSSVSKNFTTVNPEEPTPPTVTVSTKAYVGGTFTITVKSDTALTSNTVSIGGKTKTLSIGTNNFNVSDFTTSAGTISVSGTISNSAGSTTVSSSISVVEKPANTLVADWNELRIYQVMVASFQDGDPSIGYTQMYGPDNQTKGGDLQGIINAVPYIKALGCNALWMTPIFPSDTDDYKLNATGYFACDYFSIDSNFGTMAKFDELVALCHENGINVILDGVFGHNAASKKGSIGSVPNVKGVNNPGVSPSGSNPVDYANNSNSLKYYSDVARYWITEHKIDGWRFDQCYQLGNGEYNSKKNCNTGGHNYWYDIRKVVEAAASSNGTLGQDWGTLGYMVGEDWDGNASTLQASVVDSLNSAGFGLQSCFDFPAYYQVVQEFAREYGNSSKSTENITTGLKYLYSTYLEKGYSCKEDDGTYKTYYPNFMLSNHDLYRIGDLIKDKWNCSYDSSEYTGRNKVILAAQMAYTGPITIYYGDEIGDHSTDKSGWYSDNVARSSGKITGFNTREQSIHDWTQKCLSARAEHEALWNGTNEQIVGESDFYVAKKVGGGETIYIAFNYNSSSSKSFSASGTDLLSGEAFSGTVTVPALSARYILVK